MNEFGPRASRHEAEHTVAAHLFGWKVRGVWRGAHLNGSTWWTPRRDGDLNERILEAGVIILAPALYDAEGSSRDFEEITKLLVGSPTATLSVI